MGMFLSIYGDEYDDDDDGDDDDDDDDDDNDCSTCVRGVNQLYEVSARYARHGPVTCDV